MHLYRVGKAVSAFDVSALVREAMAVREHERRQKLKDNKVSIIGTLIDQAMVEFTSLEAGGRNSDGSVVASPGTPTVGAAPLNLGSFEALEGWGKEQGGQKSAARRTSLPADSFEAGNLAALEEDDDPVPPSPKASASLPQPTSSAPPPQIGVPPTTPVAGKKSGGGSGALIAVVVVVMAAAGALGAYFGGLLH
jgi:hypothetical protein